MAKQKKDSDPQGAGNDGSVQSDSTKVAEKSPLLTAAKEATAHEKAKSGKNQAGDKGMAKETASKKDDKEEKKSLAQTVTGVIQFLKEVVVEFKKITWPGRAQILKETWSVLFLVAAITLMVLGFDWFLNHAIFVPLEEWARMHGGGYGSGLGSAPR